jgi:hypothetical protein
MTLPQYFQSSLLFPTSFITFAPLKVVSHREKERKREKRIILRENSSFLPLSLCETNIFHHNLTSGMI